MQFARKTITAKIGSHKTLYTLRCILDLNCIREWCHL